MVLLMALKIGKAIAKWTVILTAIDYSIFAMLVVFSLIIISNLGAELYGIFNISSTLYIYFSRILLNIFLIPFVKIASGYYGKKEFDELSSFIGFTFVFILIMSAAQSILYALIVPYVSIELYDRAYVVNYMLSFTPIFLALSIIGYSKRILLSIKSYQKMALVRIMDGLIYIGAISLLVCYHSWSVNALVYGTLLYNFLLAILLFMFAYKELRKNGIKITLNFKLSYAKDLLQAGKYFLIGNILLTTFFKIDELIIPIYVTDESVGYYSFAKTLILRLSNLFNRLSSLLYQAFSEQAETDIEGSILLKLLNKSVLYMFLFTVPTSFFFAIFAREIILGASFLINILNYLNAAPLLSVFGFVIIIESVSAVITAYFNGIGNFGMQVKVYFIILLTAILLVPLLTSFLGVFGTSIAFVVSHFNGLTCWLINAHKQTKIKINKVTLLALLSFIVGIFMKEVIMMIGLNTLNLLNNFITIIIVGITYFILIIVLSLCLSIIDRSDIITMKKITKRYALFFYLIQLIEKIYNIFHKM